MRVTTGRKINWGFYLKPVIKVLDVTETLATWGTDENGSFDSYGHTITQSGPEENSQTSLLRSLTSALQ